MASPLIELLRPDGTLLVRSEGEVAQWLIENSDLLQILWGNKNTPGPLLQVELPDHLLVDPAVASTIYRLFSSGTLMATTYVYNANGRPRPGPATPFANTSAQAIEDVLGYFMLPPDLARYSKGAVEAPVNLPVNTAVANRQRFLHEQSPETLRNKNRRALRHYFRTRENIQEQLDFDPLNDDDREFLEERIAHLEDLIHTLEQNPTEPLPYPFEPTTEAMTNAEYRAFLEDQRPRNRLERDPLNVPLGIFNGEGGRKRTRRRGKAKRKSRKVRK